MSGRLVGRGSMATDLALDEQSNAIDCSAIQLSTRANRRYEVICGVRYRLYAKVLVTFCKA